MKKAPIDALFLVTLKDYAGEIIVIRYDEIDPEDTRGKIKYPVVKEFGDRITIITDEGPLNIHKFSIENRFEIPNYSI